MTTDPDPGDPFDTLGLPPAFDLDPAALARAYLAAAVRLHPDIAGPDSAARSAQANHARAVLQDPESRASALLARLGGPAKEQDRSLPDGFLLEMMEVREAIEHAQASGDPREVERWRAWANARRADYTRRVGGLFQRHAAAGRGVEEALRSEIRKELNGWRYVERLIEQLEPAPDAPKSSTGDPGMGPA